jgi:RNA polymerase sigma-70 factor (ECF subfamily)
LTDWEAILREYGSVVWRTAHRLLGNRADADECFQETFTAAVEFVRRGPDPVRKWSALLVRLATARAIDRLRQRVRRSDREATGVDPNLLVDRQPDSLPPDRAEQAELSARLRSVLAHLPPKQADVFCLHCLEGWSYREVAEHVDTSIDDVGILLFRARAALRERIASIVSREATICDESRTRNRSAPTIGEVTHEQ